MTKEELKALQQRIKFDAPSMAASLGIPYHTYRNYFFGVNAIPAHIERAAMELEQVQKEYDLQRDREYCEFLDRTYPHGIMSEVSANG